MARTRGGHLTSKDSQNRPYHYESRANLITHVDVFATRSAETDLVLAEERKYRDVLSNMDLLFRYLRLEMPVS